MSSAMQKLKIEKVTVNIGVGSAGEELKKAEEIIKKITGAVPVRTICKVKQPAWGIREGLPIGVKVTLRGVKAVEFLKKGFEAVDKKIKASSFDNFGNFGFGIKEYIDIPGIKYDPKLGMKGCDVLVALQKPGYRIKHRRLKRKKIPKSHAVRKNEAIDFIKSNFGVEIE